MHTRITRTRTRTIALLAAVASFACLAALAPMAQDAARARIEQYAKAPKEHPKLAFITNGVASFWTIAATGAKQAQKDLGCQVEVLMPTDGVSGQKRMLEDSVTRGVDGIAVSPIDADNQTDVLDRIAKRTLLITHDSDAPKSKRLAYIGVDNYEAGRLCGTLVKEALPQGGKVFILVGRLEQDNAKLRRQGLMDELLDRTRDPKRIDPPSTPIKGAKYEVLGTLTDQFDRVKAKANCEDALSRTPDINCFVGLFEYNPPLILEALKGAGKLGQVKVVAFDEAPETLAAIRTGNCSGTVVQDPYNYGYRSMEMLVKLCKGDASALPKDGFVNIPARAIRKDNVDAFEAKLKELLGK